MFKNQSSISTRLIVLMFSIIFLLNLNFTILRSVRSTLAVADLRGSASAIPYFELLGVLPGAFLMTWLISYLLKRFSMRASFLVTLGFFIIFYVFFALSFPILRTFIDHHYKIVNMYKMLFYILGELWKPALIHMLFWGFINLHLPLVDAKQIFPSLMLGASLGSVLAGPIIMGCTSLKMWTWIPISPDPWTHSFILMMLLVCVIGVAIGFLYYRMSESFAMFRVENLPKGDSISLKTSIQGVFQSSPLRWICWIVLADYIAYSLGEVIFLEVLKQKFPAPRDYCNYLGHLTFWSSTLTMICAVLFTPLCVKKCRWITVALVLPVALLVIEGSFFLVLRIESRSISLFGLTHNEWLTWVVFLGSCQYCAGRALKYTFFDTAKELAFVTLPKIEQMQGKLVVDGICSRLGRGGASLLSLVFISFAGGILGSSVITGVTAFCLSLSWVSATYKVGKQIDTDEKKVSFI